MYNLSFWISQLFTILTWHKKCLKFMILVMIYTCQDKFPTDAEKKKVTVPSPLQQEIFLWMLSEPISWSQLSTRSLRQMLCGSHIEIWNLANHKKQNKNIKMLDLLMKTKKQRVWCSLFYLSCDLQDFSF